MVDWLTKANICVAPDPANYAYLNTCIQWVMAGSQSYHPQQTQHSLLMIAACCRHQPPPSHWRLCCCQHQPPPSSHASTGDFAVAPPCPHQGLQGLLIIVVCRTDDAGWMLEQKLLVPQSCMKESALLKMVAPNFVSCKSL